MDVIPFFINKAKLHLPWRGESNRKIDMLAIEQKSRKDSMLPGKNLIRILRIV